MYKFQYDYVKSKYGEKIKLCFIDTGSFFTYIKIDDLYIDIDIAENIKTWFDTSNYELDRPLSKGKNKKVAGLRKDESGGKIMIKFVKLRAKTYSYSIGDDSEDKNGKGTKKCVLKRKLKFENSQNCFEETQLDNKINYLGKDKINNSSFKRKNKWFIKNNRLILKTQYLKRLL